ncbi:MAG TPA: hypothetical protein VF050_05910 [Moraxellaceae bacterium]
MPAPVSAPAANSRTTTTPTASRTTLFLLQIAMGLTLVLGGAALALHFSRQLPQASLYISTAIGSVVIISGLWRLFDDMTGTRAS